MRLAFDASTPPTSVPSGATTACIYAGGDTPLPIRDPRAVPVYGQVRWWLPGWVRSSPTPAKGRPDAAAMLSWLRANAAPAGSSIFVDVETAVTAGYLVAFGAAMHAGGFSVLVYESIANRGTNPALDGRFVADPGATGLFPGSVATQYAYEGAFDLDYVTEAVPLWDANPPAGPAAGAGGPVPFRAHVAIAHGAGWFALPGTQRGGDVVAVDVDDVDPAALGHYAAVPAYAGPTPDGRVLVFGAGPQGPAPDGLYGFTYWYEAPAS